MTDRKGSPPPRRDEARQAGGDDREAGFPTSVAENGARGWQDANPETLRLIDITRRFPGVLALDRVELVLRGGECHALLGQNGAGKSTLVKIISGADRPDAGEMYLDGEPVRFHRPSDAHLAGIYTIYQELSLVPGLSVAENIYISDLPRRRWGPVHWARLQQAAAETLSALGFAIDVTKPVRGLPVAERQAVEIAKAVHHKAKILLLDEPTATLPKPDVQKLFDALRRLQRTGVGVLYISHRLDEVYEMCDRVTVLRDGRNVTTRATAELSQDDAVRAMVGDRLVAGLVGQAAAGRRRRINPRPVNRDAPPIFEVDSVSDEHLLHDVSLTVRPGEAVGVVGLVGSGQSRLGECLFGSTASTSGEVTVAGRALGKHSPRAAIRAGIGLVPEDRKWQGLVLNMAVTPNISMASLPRVSRMGLLGGRAEQRLADAMVRDLDIHPPRTTQAAGNLSGGNQQKVVFAKWMAAGAKVMIYSEPTRGVDVAAKEGIYRAIGEFLADGGSALILSSELDEALMCDRVYVMAQGRIVGEYDHDDIEPARLLSLLR